MIEVWQDAEVPVEYRAPELHFQNWGKVGFLANLIQTISPLIMIVISILFVVMSYYVAPSTLVIKENPTVYPPLYYLAVGQLLIRNQSEPAINTASFLFSNFPQFTENQITSRTVGGRLSSAVTDEQYLDIRLSLPYNRAAKNESLMHLTILFPLTINFPTIDHKNVHTMVHYQVSNPDFDTISCVGRLLLTQHRPIPNDEPYTTDKMETVLKNELTVSGNRPFDIDYILNQFENSSFSVKIVKAAQTVDNFSNETIKLHLQLRVPEIFAEIEAPFWNMFKVTYVQLFYWFWLVYFVWNLFIRTGFVYGIIPATVHHVLRPSKPKLD